MRANDLRKAPCAPRRLDTHSLPCATNPPPNKPHHTKNSANPAATAALFTGAYALAAGAALVAAPKAALGLLFDASAVPPGWIRVGGVLFATFGLQYLGAALGDFWLLSKRREAAAAAAAAGRAAAAGATGTAAAAAAERREERGGDGGGGAAPSVLSQSSSSTGFYWATVWARLALAAAFAGLVAAGCCERGLLVLAALNAAGAASMASALRRQGRALAEAAAAARQ